MFTDPFPKAFGLDIGDLSIKLVQLKRNSLFHKQHSFVVENCRSINLPPGLIVNGELQKPEGVRKRIEHLLHGQGEQKPITSPWVVSALPESQTFIKLIETNTPPEKLLEEDIRLLAKKHLPFEDNDSFYLKWQIMPNIDGENNKTRILIGAAIKVIADSYTYLLESLGLGVIALEIEALAIARAMITAQKGYEGEARALLDLGATRSSFIIYDHDIIQFSTSLPFSGEIITTALSQKLHITDEEAEEIKIKQGLDYKKRKDTSWLIMEKLTADLIEYIQDSINFYYTHFPNTNRVTRITMCGGGSNLNRLNTILSHQLKILTQPGRPWKNLFSHEPDFITKEESLGYATAIGLALRAADNPFHYHNII